MHDEGKFVNALIPFWDLSNHSDAVAEISTDYDDEAHVVRCLANKDFKEGEQFTIFYGRRSVISFIRLVFYLKKSLGSQCLINYECTVKYYSCSGPIATCWSTTDSSCPTTPTTAWSSAWASAAKTSWQRGRMISWADWEFRHMDTLHSRQVIHECLKCYH